jgi:hypothetical protein
VEHSGARWVCFAHFDVGGVQGGGGGVPARRAVGWADEMDDGVHGDLPLGSDWARGRPLGIMLGFWMGIVKGNLVGCHRQIVMSGLRQIEMSG